MYFICVAMAKYAFNYVFLYKKKCELFFIIECSFHEFGVVHIIPGGVVMSTKEPNTMIRNKAYHRIIREFCEKQHSSLVQISNFMFASSLLSLSSSPSHCLHHSKLKKKAGVYILWLLKKPVVCFH